MNGETELAQAIDAIPYEIVGIILFVFVVGMMFLMSPLSNVLNIITAPLGYEYSSCPYCPKFGVTKIQYETCEQCGKKHGRGFAAPAFYGDETHMFCSNECLQEWHQDNDE